MMAQLTDEGDAFEMWTTPRRGPILLLVVAGLGLVPCPATSAPVVQIRGRVQIEPLDYRGPSSAAWLATGIRAAVTNDLSRAPNVEVITVEDQTKALQTVAERRKAGETGIDVSAEAARILGADYRCVGLLTNTKDSLVVEIKILKVPGNAITQRAVVHGSKDDVFSMQDRIVATLLQKLDGTGKPAGGPSLLPRHPKAFELYSKGIELLQRDPKGALKSLHAALEIEPNFADALIFSGRAHEARGEMDRALEMYEKAKTVLERSAGLGTRQYATVLNNIGAVQARKGLWAEARDYFEAARAAREKLGATWTNDYAVNLSNLGLAQANLGNSDLAMRLYGQAQKIREQRNLVHTDTYCATLNNIAGIYHGRGDLDQALLHFERAQGLRTKIGLLNTTASAVTLANIGLVQMEKGRARDAVKTLSEAVRIRKALELDQGTEHARVLSALGASYSATGRNQEALVPLKHAAELLLLAKLGRSVEFALVLENTGVALLGIGRQADALDRGERARLLLRDLGRSQTREYARVLQLIANAQIAQKTQCRSLPVLQELYKLYVTLKLHEQAKALVERIRGLQYNCDD